MTAENETPRPPEGYETWLDWAVAPPQFALAPGSWAAASAELSALRARVAELEVELKDATYWRERNSTDAHNNGVQSVDHWNRWKAAEAEVARLTKALEEIVRNYSGLEPEADDAALWSKVARQRRDIARAALAPPPQADGGAA